MKNFIFCAVLLVQKGGIKKALQQKEWYEPEASSDLSQTSKMEHFAKIVNGFQCFQKGPVICHGNSGCRCFCNGYHRWDLRKYIAYFFSDLAL